MINKEQLTSDEFIKLTNEEKIAELKRTEYSVGNDIKYNAVKTLTDNGYIRVSYREYEVLKNLNLILDEIDVRRCIMYASQISTYVKLQDVADYIYAKKEVRKYYNKEARDKRKRENEEYLERVREREERARKERGE